MVGFWPKCKIFPKMTTLYSETTKWIPTQISKKQNFFNFCANELARSKNWKNFVFWIFGDGIRNGHGSRFFSRFWCIHCLILPFLDKFQVFWIFYTFSLIFKFFKNFGGFLTNFRGFLTFLIFFFHYFDRFLHKLMF